MSSKPTLATRAAPRQLVERLEARRATIGVIGLGYVGLPLGTAFAEAGFRVVGVDGDPERLKALRDGRSYIRDVRQEQVAKLMAARRLKATGSYRSLSGADAVLICVPTPLHNGAPDLRAVEAAARGLSRVLRPGTLVVLESTTYPGTTEELLRPLLEANGLAAGSDFLLAYSPERIDPGNPYYGLEDIPKVVGGTDSASSRAAAALYGTIVPKVIVVSGSREAEMAKLIENTFRHVNIALVNELAVYAHEWGIDIWESIEAAATKPFGFQAFWPGPGWGGHCIPLDPSYLSWRVRRDHSHEMRFVELAHAVNSEMPRHVVERITRLLNDRGKAVRGARILHIGVAYKAGTEDTRGSPALKVMTALEKRGARVAYHDPLVPEVRLGERTIRSVALNGTTLGDQDLVVAVIAQTDVDWNVVHKESPLLFDCCNAMGKRNGSVERL